jgi:ATP-dependent exoDNAse (exonuclease V) alpha subunit
MTQSQALSILKTGANVFLTGEPGSGKTHTINLYIKYLREHGLEVAVTASTGIAATHLGGMTIHSWSGIGIKKTLSNYDLENLRSKSNLVSRAQKTTTLVIDEISMLDAQTLSTVNTAVSALRYSDKPFGGMQVIFVGDFFQLPPVTRGEETTKFAFESGAWQAVNPVICYLSEQHRQQDPKFLSLLSAIRSKTQSNFDVHQVLSTRKVDIKIEESVTRLYSHNLDVGLVNEQKLEKLPAEQHKFQMTHTGNKKIVEQLQKSCLSPETLVLKKGARVMFTKNNPVEGFVNGTLGEVIDFENGAPVVKTSNGREILVPQMDWELSDGVKTLATITQFPLRLAWAITVHKSQGMTLDAAVMDLSAAFEYGQGYVAISRVRSLSSLYLLGINDKALQVHPDISQTDIEFKYKSKKALNALSKYGEQELLKKHQKFILNNGGSLTKVAPKKLTSTYDQTLELYIAGKTISQIAKTRKFTEGTIISHLEKLKAENKISSKDLTRIITKDLSKKLPEIHKVFNELGTEKLSPVFQKLNGKYSYDELKLARLMV